MNPLLKFLYSRKSARLYKQARKIRRDAAKAKLQSEGEAASLLKNAACSYELAMIRAERAERLARANSRRAQLGGKRGTVSHFVQSFPGYELPSFPTVKEAAQLDSLINGARIRL